MFWLWVPVPPGPGPEGPLGFLGRVNAPLPFFPWALSPGLPDPAQAGVDRPSSPSLGIEEDLLFPRRRGCSGQVGGGPEGTRESQSLSIRPCRTNSAHEACPRLRVRALSLGLGLAWSTSQEQPSALRTCPLCLSSCSLPWPSGGDPRAPRCRVGHFGDIQVQMHL